MKLRITKGRNLQEGKPSPPFGGKKGRRRTPSSEHSSKGNSRLIEQAASDLRADGFADWEGR